MLKKKGNSDLLYRMDVCWNGFQMDPGGSRGEITKELCKVQMEGALKSQTIYLGGICSNMFDVSKTLWSVS